MAARTRAPTDSAPESLANTPSDAGKGPPGHPAQSPRAWGLFVTIVALVILALIVWVVLF